MGELRPKKKKNYGKAIGVMLQWKLNYTWALNSRLSNFTQMVKQTKKKRKRKSSTKKIRNIEKVLEICSSGKIKVKSCKIPVQIYRLLLPTKQA